MNIIEELKKNEKPFGLMSKEMQEKAKEIGVKEFDPWMGCSSARWCSEDRSDPQFYHHRTYRLRPDYTEEPEVVKCEVKPCVDRGDLYYWKNGKAVVNIAVATIDPDFIGFLYEDERLHDFKHPTNKMRLYMDKNGNVYSVYMPGFEVLTPTHVLFKGK